jgi:bifunctional DNA-binding transcriptional regulator/antitoxin component of YhaV-PrlF toxin-antitoxin module
MTTTLTKDGHIVVAKAVRQRQRLRSGDEFEIIADAGEPGVLELRRMGRKPNQGLLELLRACPVRGFRIPKRSKELPSPPIEL